MKKNDKLDLMRDLRVLKSRIAPGMEGPEAAALQADLEALVGKLDAPAHEHPPEPAAPEPAPEPPPKPSKTPEPPAEPEPPARPSKPHKGGRGA